MSSVHGTRDEVDVIQQEICQVEEMIVKLQEKRISLLQRLNIIRASTRVLPPEALSLIFEYATCPPTYFCPEICAFVQPGGSPCDVIRPSFPPSRALTLSHVSSHWRQVVWSTPQLWTDLSVVVSKKNARHVPDILELYLRNVRTLPINLGLGFAAKYGDIKEAIPLIGSVLFNDEQCRKIRAVLLDDVPAEWIPLISANLSQLEYISIQGISQKHLPSPDDTLSLQALHHLRGVRLHIMGWKILLPSSSVTHLDLNMVPIDVCAKLLTECPNLVRFKSNEPDDVFEELAEPYFPGATTLSRLQDFSWSFYHDSWSLAVFQPIQLPALRTPTCITNQCDSLEVELSIRALLINISNTLHSLHLIWLAGWTRSSIAEAFCRVSSIQELSLENCDQDTVYDILSVLSTGRRGDRIKHLPSLTSLRISWESWTGWEVLGADFTHQILEFCEGRVMGPGSSFKFEITHFEIHWAPGVREKLSAMEREGLRLKVQLLSREI